MEVEVLDKALSGDSGSIELLKEFINTVLDKLQSKFGLINLDDNLRNDIVGYTIEDLIKYRKIWEDKINIEKAIKLLIRRSLFCK